MKLRILNGTNLMMDFFLLRQELTRSDWVSDAWDSVALALGLVDGHKLLAACRLVPRTMIGLPMEGKDERVIAKLAEMPSPVELSNLVIGHEPPAQAAHAFSAHIVDTALSLGHSHIVAAMTPAFARYSRKFGYSFEEIGPHFEWRGRVFPFAHAL